MSTPDPYLSAFRGRFSGILRWPQLDALWQTLREHGDKQWYIYAVGEAPPATPASPEQLAVFLDEVDKLLREEHAEDYCGIVYTDNPDDPAFIKIFDPNNLGVVCGFSDNPPLPGWILSTLPPIDLQSALPPPGNRRRWWRRLIGTT
ncbi:MAG TPA: hypothetical protein EYP40_12425 [Chromatiales bacterium]|nr:hypothetical protein [Chromatiales bacterium]